MLHGRLEQKSVRKESAKAIDGIFAKTCFDGSVGIWSARTEQKPRFLIAFLDFFLTDAIAHNPKVVGSSPASATNNANRFRYRGRKVRNHSGFGLFLYEFS